MDLEQKKKIAFNAQKMLEDKISFDEFCSEIPEDIDNDIAELVNMVEHLPSRKTIFGNDQKEFHDKHIQEINKLIDKILE